MTFYAFIIINIITFFVYGLDKLKAVNHWWRICRRVSWHACVPSQNLEAVVPVRSAGNDNSTGACHSVCVEIKSPEETTGRIRKVFRFFRKNYVHFIL